MASVTALSFESDGIRIVSGTLSDGIFSPQTVQTIAESDLEVFLANDPADSYLVAISPAETIYETVTIPPVDARLTPILARNEAARLHPELQEFSCALQVIGDIPLEGRTIRKVACCLVPHTDIQPILEPFIRHGKMVRQMVAAPFALAPMLDRRESAEEGSGTVLCAFDGGVAKTLFLAEDGAVIFARSVSSNGYGWDPFDRQNISMTLDYCFQSLRMRPGKVVLLNPRDGEQDPDLPPPRLIPLPPPAVISAEPSVLLEYMIPLMLAAVPQSSTSDLLPKSYREQITQQNLLRRTALLFLAGSLILLVLIGLRSLSIRSLQTEIAALKRQQANIAAIHQEHRQALSQRDADQPLIAAMNEILAPPDIPRFLVAFDQVRVSGVAITGLQATRDKDTVTLQVSGTTSGTSFSASQLQFESFLAVFRKIPGITVTTQQTDLINKTFTVGAGYKP